MPLQTYAEFLPTLIGARIEQGLPQSALAANIGVAPAAVSLWEARRRTPCQENAEAWAEALGVTLPLYATVWFARKTMSGEQRHGTRGGYDWHRTHNDMPACDPCKAAAARYQLERRHLRERG